jgi:fructose-bisphosphate aldolase, class I
MNEHKLNHMAKELVSRYRGILATDATEETMNKRMQAVGIDPNPELRRQFRELLLTTEGASEFISGVILNDEIIRQKTSEGVEFAKLIRSKGMIPGIKADKKAFDMANFPGEKITEGLDGLRDRLAEYGQMGAEFTKWRAVIKIGDGIPTDVCIEANAEALARYAALAQEAGLVPIVEPEVLMEGGHGIDKCAEVTGKVLKEVFKKLSAHKILFSGMLLKPNMVHPGKESDESRDDGKIAEKTLEVFSETVPDEVAGIVFLSGGDPAEEITGHLNEINLKNTHPWELSFSFERALEGPAMEIWKGSSDNWDMAQGEFLKRARLNSLARRGEYRKETE